VNNTVGQRKMKPVPPHIIASGPPGTEWFGGAVDRSTMTLRVMAKIRGESVDKKEISQLLGCEPDQEKFRHWSLDAPDKEEADLDAQVDWILLRVTADLGVWKKITEAYRVDLFCALYLERSNRGVTLAPKTMLALGARGIELGLDIYAPEKEEPNQTSEPTAPSGRGSP
jgi:Domain of unknown function (DUF4279)